MAETLERTGRVAVAQTVFHEKESLVAVRSHQNGLVMHSCILQMRYATLRKSPSLKAQRCRNVRSISLVIDKMSVAEFEPEKYQHEYRERFLAMVEQKTKGKEITIPRPAPERRGKVVDIFAALKKSLEQAAPQRQREPAREPVRKAGGKRRKA